MFKNILDSVESALYTSEFSLIYLVIFIFLGLV